METKLVDNYKQNRFRSEPCSALYRIALTEGQAKLKNGSAQFEYYLSDHLGNARVVFDQLGQIKQMVGFLQKGSDELKSKAEWVPFLGPVTDISQGAVKKDRTQVVLGMAGLVGDALGGSGKKGSNIALGVREYLDDFAIVVNGSTWKTWGAKDFETGFLSEISNSSNYIHFNLTGIENPWSAISQGAKGYSLGGYTNWELYQIYSNPLALERTIFYKDGRVIPNPFK